MDRRGACGYWRGVKIGDGLPECRFRRGRRRQLFGRRERLLRGVRAMFVRRVAVAIPSVAPAAAATAPPPPALAAWLAALASVLRRQLAGSLGDIFVRRHLIVGCSNELARWLGCRCVVSRLRGQAVCAVAAATAPSAPAPVRASFGRLGRRGRFGRLGLGVLFLVGA
jgi:hypothetical protein